MKILLVEDEIGVAKFIIKGLKEEGYQLELAKNGEEGEYFALLNSYDLFINDIMLPKLDGISLLKIIRNKKINTPVLMLTAKNSVEDKVKGLDAGADDYLTKPFSFDEFFSQNKSFAQKKKQ